MRGLNQRLQRLEAEAPQRPQRGEQKRIGYRVDSTARLWTAWMVERGDVNLIFNAWAKHDCSLLVALRDHLRWTNDYAVERAFVARPNWRIEGREMLHAAGRSFDWQTYRNEWSPEPLDGASIEEIYQALSATETKVRDYLGTLAPELRETIEAIAKLKAEQRVVYRGCSLSASRQNELDRLLGRLGELAADVDDCPFTAERCRFTTAF